MKSWKEIVNLYNVPDYADTHDYLVVKYVDGELWFYGAYDAEERAIEVAEAEKGIALAK